MARILLLILTLLLMPKHVFGLEMSALTEEKEKLLSVDLWGEIVPGDETKFDALVLPYVRAGYLVFAVNVFTPGGNVAAAMGISQRVRILNARTIAPTCYAHIVNNRRVRNLFPSCWFSKKLGSYVFPQPDEKNRPCNCASACFIIWASGVAREGNYVAIHRLFFNASAFGKMSALEAREQYNSAETSYRTYLQQLSVPSPIIDRLFAIDSQSVHVLTELELELMESTPFLEEHTLARCGPDKSQHMSAANNWTYTQDTEHVKCYREILKELMKDGAQKYLERYGH